MSGLNILIKRRNFLFGLAGFLSVGFGIGKFFSRKANAKVFPGEIKGANAKFGHILRQNNLGPGKFVSEHDVVIVGGGIAGLSAAWHFKKKGIKNVRLLELDSEVGGNSRSDKNEISSYPLGAHYLPFPGKDSRYVFELLEELKVITGYDQSGLPVYNEEFICADPNERLKIHGVWQEGLVPNIGIDQEDRRQYQEFFASMEEFKSLLGSDNKPAFTIPLELSSADTKFRELNNISMKKFMELKKWNSKYLNWYVNYCCRDDYGAGSETVSAWAAIHYFASRKGKAANASSSSVLTWPEGNGWLVKQLRERVGDFILPNNLVYKVETVKGSLKTAIDYLNIEKQRQERLVANHVVFAAPRFVANRVVKRFEEKVADYAPWMVANISLKGLPESHGAPLSWDNVHFGSESLGYIVATHQNLSLFPHQTVLTYYLPLDKDDPKTARQNALMKSHAEWVDIIVKDLKRMHAGIDEQILNIDVWLWGHAMPIPKPGQLFKGLAKNFGNVHFAHSDMSGISIFEEAQYQGIEAAERILRNMNSRSRGMA